MTVTCPICSATVETERGLQSHKAQKHPDERIYADESWLREKYVEEKLSLAEVAELAGCEPTTIRRALKEHGIERRSKGYASRKPGMPYAMGPYGRMHWRSTRGDGDGGKVAYGFEVHRLLAIAEYGPDAVAGMDVHHKNRIPWDNRPENIELLSREEHGKIHSEHARKAQ